MAVPVRDTSKQGHLHSIPLGTDTRKVTTEESPFFPGAAFLGEVLRPPALAHLQFPGATL